MQPRLRSLRWASKPESNWAANTRVALPGNDPTSELEQYLLPRMAVRYGT